MGIKALTSTALKSGLELYLKQIDETPLLTPQQERDLCWQIIHENCPLARDQMVRSNLRLVVAIAKRYINDMIVCECSLSVANSCQPR